MTEARHQGTGFRGFDFESIVERRGELDGRPWISYPVRVVADTPELVALYLAHGTRLAFGHGEFRWGPHPWEQIGDRWQSAGVLQLHRPGRAHSVWVFKDPGTGAFREWYINLEAPWRRTSAGFATLDHEIDLIVPPGARTCRWKDVEKFERRVRLGHFSSAEAAAIRAEAHDVASEVAAGAQWWEASWSRWQARDDWDAAVPRTSESEGISAQ